ncbi:MAG: 16S rRNA (guanine(527)-N(7))-methyltransferase RsmG [Candidatus Methylomirabilales bacterium]
MAADASEAGSALSRAQIRALGRYKEVLEAKGLPLGLISRSDSKRIYERHLMDSLRAAQAFGPEDASAYDFGSGAGLPGIVLAIARPQCRFFLVDSGRRRVAFLEYAVEALGLSNAVPVLSRVQDLMDPADVVVARAFAPLSRTWPVAAPLLSSGGRLVYFGGASMKDPVREGRLAAERGDRSAQVEVVANGSPLVIMTAS